MLNYQGSSWCCPSEQLHIGLLRILFKEPPSCRWEAASFLRRCTVLSHTCGSSQRQSLALGWCKALFCLREIHCYAKACIWKFHPAVANSSNQGPKPTTSLRYLPPWNQGMLVIALTIQNLLKSDTNQTLKESKNHTSWRNIFQITGSPTSLF